MLVFLKQPMSYSVIEGKRIYGESFAYGSFGPTNVSPKFYKKHKSVLKPFVYTKRYLDKKYGGDFPDVSFVATKMAHLNWQDQITIARLIGIPYVTKVRNPTKAQGMALRRTILNKLSE